jgi:hypothetical protein
MAYDAEIGKHPTDPKQSTRKLPALQGIIAHIARKRFILVDKSQRAPKGYHKVYNAKAEAQHGHKLKKVNEANPCPIAIDHPGSIGTAILLTMAHMHTHTDQLGVAQALAKKIKYLHK